MKTTAKAPCPIRSLRENSNLPTVSRPPRPGSMARAGAAGGPGGPGSGGAGRGPRAGGARHRAGRGRSQPGRGSDATPSRPGSDSVSDTVPTGATTRFGQEFRLRLGPRRGNKRAAAAGPQSPRRPRTRTERRGRRGAMGRGGARGGVLDDGAGS